MTVRCQFHSRTRGGKHEGREKEGAKGEGGQRLQSARIPVHNIGCILDSEIHQPEISKEGLLETHLLVD